MKKPKNKRRILNTLREISRYPSGNFIERCVLILIITAIVVVIVIPYNEAIDTWRGGEEVVGKNPRNASPLWFNWFRKDDLS